MITKVQDPLTIQYTPLYLGMKANNRNYKRDICPLNLLKFHPLFTIFKKAKKFSCEEFSRLFKLSQSFVYLFCSVMCFSYKFLIYSLRNEDGVKLNYIDITHQN